MNLPDFTAEASLYRTNNSYRSLEFDQASPQRNGVIPQLGYKDYKGFGGCINDCMDRLEYSHPELTLEQAKRQCSKNCRDPFTGHDLGTSRGWFNEFLTNAGIDLWEEACSHLVHPYPCRVVADIIRRQS